MALKNVTIFIEENGNQKAIKNYPLVNKVKNSDKQANTVLCICLINLICQHGVYFCLFRLEENSILIGGIGLVITCLFIVIFYIGYYKKFKNYKYTNVAYIICQSLLMIIIVLRICQYICYSTIHKIYVLEIQDPFNNVNREIFTKGMSKHINVLIRSSGAIVFLLFWTLGLRKCYILYKETSVIVKNRSNLKKFNKMRTEPIQVGTQKANWNQPCIF